MNADVKKQIGNALWGAFITPKNDTELRNMVYGANECFDLNWTDENMDHLVQTMTNWLERRNGLSKRDQENSIGYVFEFGLKDAQAALLRSQIDDIDLGYVKQTINDLFKMRTLYSNSKKKVNERQI